MATFTALRLPGDLVPIEDHARHLRYCGNNRYAVEATPGYFYGDPSMALRHLI
jgi:hypothetical protein